jgi:hypothetical protein
MFFNIIIFIQGDTRVMMSTTEFKMQPKIHLEGKAGYLPYIQLYVANVLWVAFSILSSSLLLVNHLVYKIVSYLCTVRLRKPSL